MLYSSINVFLSFSEASILVLANDSSASQKDFGSIFVSGRIEFGTTANEDSFTRYVQLCIHSQVTPPFVSSSRKRRGAKEIYEEQMVKPVIILNQCYYFVCLLSLQIRSLGHYSTYAIEGKSGTLLWKHEPGDFEIQPAYEYTSSFVVSNN